MKTDEDIVDSIVSGDIDAYGVLMSRYEQKLLRYVIYLARDQVSASDIVQDTFIKAYQNLRGFNKKYKFSSWIYRIAHNETMNAIKHGKHIDGNTDIYDLEDKDSDESIINKIDSAILSGKIKACLNDLDNKYREVLMLQYFEDIKYSEIADILRIPISTVGVWSRRAKEKLKQICIKKGFRHE